MDNIEYDNSTEEDRIVQLLEKWLHQDHGTGGLPRTWPTVVQAVKDTGMGLLAQHGVQLFTDEQKSRKSPNPRMKSLRVSVCTGSDTYVYNIDIFAASFFLDLFICTHKCMYAVAHGLTMHMESHSLYGMMWIETCRILRHS